MLVSARADRLLVQSVLVSGAFYPLGDDAFFCKSMPHHVLRFVRDGDRVIDEVRVLFHGIVTTRMRRRT
jgi:hypothetical protein